VVDSKDFPNQVCRLVQAGVGVDGTTTVSAERGGDTAGSVRIVLTGLWGWKEMLVEIRWA